MELKITAMTLQDAAAVLSKAGGHVSVETLEKHIAAGAPANADGAISLIHYAAWLNGELSRREVDSDAH